jgi:VWFA-related protein
MRNRTASPILLLGLLLLIPIGACWGLGQDPLGTLHVDVSLVEVNVSVLDSDGRPRTALSKDDFVVYDDGVPQEIAAFSPIETPYSMLLLLDRSGSTREATPLLIAAINGFVNDLRAQDRYMVASFAEYVKTLVDWRTRSLSPLSAVPPEASGFTDFYGALKEVAIQLEGMSGRRGAIVLTDGAHTGVCPRRRACENESQLIGAIPTKTVTLNGTQVRRLVDSADDRGFQSVLRAIRKSGVPFYFVAVDTDLNPWGYFSPTDLVDKQQLRSRMEELADVSGGKIAFPRRPENLAALYSDIAHDMGTAYSLGWYPSSRSGRVGGYRKIEVRARSGFLTVQQSRQGYYSQ